MAVDDMNYQEFLSLLSGLLPETPLGIVVDIRRENDRERLKHFTPEQRQIRSEWRSKSAQRQQAYFNSMTDDQKEQTINGLKEMFKQAFS